MDTALPPPESIAYNPRAVPFARRVRIRLIVLAARLLAARPPNQIRRVLRLLHRNTRPAAHAETLAARHAVVSVSLACAGREGCLVRSLAVVLLCRTNGAWPTWCVGARRLAPFYAHAWVEAEGVMVGEEYPVAYFRRFFTVP